jgi:hypothetical protein
MIAQPSGGVGSCASGCPAPKHIKGAAIIQPAAAPAVTAVRAVALAPAPVVIRPGKVKPVASAPSQMAAVERQAILRRDPIIDRPLVDYVPAASVVSTDVLSVPALPAVKVKPAPVFASSSAGIAKSPEQRAQDAWDARQRLAYIDPILPNDFAYAEVIETAPGKLQVVAALTDLQGVSVETTGPADSASAQELHNNKSQAPSAPMAGQKLEPLSK